MQKMGTMAPSAAKARMALMQKSSAAQPSSIAAEAPSCTTPAAHEGPHLLHVVGEAGEELPGLGSVVVAEAQALDAGEETFAQVEGHALGRLSAR